MDINTNDCLALGMSESFLRAVRADTEPTKKEYSLLILSDVGVTDTGIEKANTVICPQRLELVTPVRCQRVITCGMSANSTVSFSCIDGSRALLSLSRNVGGTEPGEVYVIYRKELSVYENLVFQALRLLNIR